MVASEQFRFTTQCLIKGGGKMKPICIAVLFFIVVCCGYRTGYAVSMGVGSSGEVNTLSSVGTATSIVSGKVGVDLQTKSLAGTGGTTITNRGNYLEVNSSSVPTFASQAEAEGGTENTKSMNSLRTYQAVTSYSFLKSNIDISPADGYPDKANGLLGTTMSPSDTLTWSMPADKNFKIDMSGTGKLIASSGTNTVNLSGARYLDYVWTGSSTANSDNNLNTEVDIFFGTLTASSNINCVWEIEVVADQTAQINFNPAYRVYLNNTASTYLLNSAIGTNVGGIWFSGWVSNFGSTTTQLYKSLAATLSGGSTSMSSRIATLFDSKKDTNLRLTVQSGTTTAGYYCGVRCVRIWKTQP